MFSSISLPVAFAQTYYQSPYDNFNVQIPEGWVIEDSTNADTQSSLSSSSQNETTLFDIVPLAKLCSEEDSYPGLNGTFRCLSNYVLISRFNNLHSVPEFKALEQQNKSITSVDLVPLSIETITKGVTLGNSTVEIVNIGATNITYTTVNVTNSQTNQTVQTLPATHAEIRYNLTTPAFSKIFGEGITDHLKSFNLFVVTNDTNTGYAITTNDRNATELAPPEPIPQIMDSFGLIEEK